MIAKNSRSARNLRRTVVPLLALGLFAGTGTAGVADANAVPAARTSHRPLGPGEVIVLPGASSAEGIAAGAGTTFYAGDLSDGDIFRGDIRRGTARRFIDVPKGRVAFGMKADVCHGLLFVAGGQTGQAYVYNTRTGATVATYQLGTGGQLGAPGTSIINDVTLTPGGAWFTDSAHAKLHFVPVSKYGVPGKARTLDLAGPAAQLNGPFNLNGIAATPDGRTLIVAHTANQRIYTVNPATGASALVQGVKVPDVDGIVLSGRQLWAVQNTNAIRRFRLSPDLNRGTLQKVVTSPAFATPTTAALFGHRLAAVNSHFDTGVPPTSPTYEVVVTHS